MKSIPVVYIHYGHIPAYLTRSVKNASVFENDIFVLSDTKFNLMTRSVKRFPIKDFEKDLDKFKLVYKHRCSNPEEFERRCINRWFILRNFMEQKEIDACYYSDSDVMIYDNLTRLYPSYSEYDAAYIKPNSDENYKWAASGCCSYWKMKTLNSFCDFIFQLYEPGKRTPLDEKWEYHLKNNVPGGICDMTLLYLFSNEINFYSLSEVKDGIVFDSNVLISGNFNDEEYEMMVNPTNKRRMKRLLWKNDLPYGVNKVLNREIRFAALTEYAKLVYVKPTIWNRIDRRIKLLKK